MKCLKGLRETKRISQQRLAIELNISQASISKYEIGLAEPDIKTILRFAKYFGVSTDYLLGNSDKKYLLIKSDFSDDEIELIFGFRKLTSTQRIKIQSYLQGLSDW